MRGADYNVIDEPRRARGFTLLELIVAMAVAAILLGIAIPSYRSVVERNSLTANVNDLVGDLNYARSEAVSRGQPTYVCSSADQSTCSSDGDWSRGWVIYVATDPSAADPKPADGRVLRVQATTGTGFNLTTRRHPPAVFNSSGFSPGSNRCFDAASDDGNRTRKISLSVTGRVDVEPGAC